MYMYSCFSLLLIQCSKQERNKNNLNVAKCTLGKVNLTAMLVSSFPNSVGGGQPDAFAGAPCDLYKQLLACSSSQSVCARALLLACQFLCNVFFQPSLPL